MGARNGAAALSGGPPTSTAHPQALDQTSTPLKLRRGYELVAVPGELVPMVRAWVAHRERQLKRRTVATAERIVGRHDRYMALEARIAAAARG